MGVFALSSIILYALQTTLIPHIAICGVVPDLLIAALISFTILEGRERGVIAGLIMGIALDLFAATTFGVCTITYFYIAVVTGSFSMKVIGKTPLTSAIVTFFATFVLVIITSLILYILKIDENLFYQILVIAPLFSLYNAVFSFLIYFVFDAAQQLSYRRRF